MGPGSGATRAARPMLASLPLEIFLVFGGWWDVLFWLVSIAVFIYKGIILPYPNSNFAVEFTFQWLYVLVEPVRLLLGSKGNKTEQSGPLIFSVILAGPVIAFSVYYIKFQTYVLQIEVILHAISLAFCGLQVLLQLLACIRFAQGVKYA